MSRYEPGALILTLSADLNREWLILILSRFYKP